MKHEKLFIRAVMVLAALVALTLYVWSSGVRTLTGREGHFTNPFEVKTLGTFFKSLNSIGSGNVPWNSSAQIEKMTCHLPVLKPFDPSVKKWISDPGPHSCTAGHPLLFTTDFESNLLQVEDPKEFGYFNCCYQSFQRPSPGRDTSIKLDPNCVPIETGRVRVREDIDFIRVNCEKTTNNGTSASVPVDFFGFVHLKPGVEAKVRDIEEEEAFNTTQEREVNVVILGMDSVSHMNFQRVMPRTREYLVRNLSALYLNGYTRVGDNTFPNLVSILMGKTVGEIQEECWKKNSAPFDDCPFVWKNFRTRGYRTAYGEDAIWMGIFNCFKKGFDKVPTDYYYNGLAHQLRTNVGHKIVGGINTCYGPRLGFSVSLDFLQKMAVRMNRTRRYFHFIWTTSMTHSKLMQGKQGDPPLLETIKWLKDEGYLENTIFILMSDHGIRFGGIRFTVQGKYETNMPFAYFILPEWFKAKYRSAVRNLHGNRKKLTTPFDLHETLLDLSNLGNISEQRLLKRYDGLKESSLPRGISLFLPIPLRRTCLDAGIDEEFCVCRQMQSIELQGNTLIQEGARYVVHVINGMFVKVPQCSFLVLDRILNAQVLRTKNTNLLDKSANITRANDTRLSNQQVSFSLSVAVRPSNASFDAIATRHTDGSWQVLGEISRTNLYWEQSRCVSDYNLKRYCYCV